MQSDLHQQITDKIIEKMERGCAPWQKPWEGGACFDMPLNGTTDQKYRGINIPLLWMSADEHGFDCQEWASYQQWQQKKEQVRKGEKGSLIIFYKTLEKEENDKIKEVPYIQHSYVFNRCQLERYKPQPREQKPKIERLKHADEYIINTKARFYYDGGNRAYYSRKTDDIHLPEPESFKDRESMYSVTLHEIIHWTGATHRLNRTKGKRFGDQEYAFEELIAELGAAFNCAALDITKEPREDHAAYLGSWLEVLRADKTAIFTAASMASKSVDYTDGLQPGG